MVTWHLTIKLFPAKCHERATLWKLWRQTGNSSLLPAKCWPLLHVIAGISALFSNFAFVLFCYITNHFMTGPLGNSEFCFPRMTLSRKTMRFSGNKIHCSPRDQSLSVNYNIDVAKRAFWLANKLDLAICPWFARSRQFVYLYFLSAIDVDNLKT